MISSKQAPEIKISNSDKLFWPDDGYTKKDLAVYYAGIFPWLQPFVKRQNPDDGAVPGRDGWTMFLSEGNSERNAKRYTHKTHSE